MSTTIFWNIQKYELLPMPRIKHIFSEAVFPLNDNINLDEFPTEKTIYDFFILIFESQKLSAECGVMAIVYIDRLQSLTGISILKTTWRRICLGCLILASKIWEDQAVWNVDYLDVFSNLTIRDLNAIEREVLNGLQFNVALKASVYAKYYFQLRTLSERNSHNFPLNPLNKAGEIRLEKRSLGLEIGVKKNQFRRSQSYDDYSLNKQEEIEAEEIIHKDN